MNDFLHSLRTGKDKRYDRTRRGQENTPYRTNDRQGTMDKRKHGNYTKSSAAENAYVTIAKLLPPVKTLLDTIAAGQKAYLEIEKRNAQTMESIAFSLKKIAGIDREEGASVNLQTKAAAKLTDATVSEDVDEMPDLTRMIPADMIREMRAQGLSYDKIALQLDTEKIPTPSGKGKWRGQIVSKILKG